MLAYWPGMPGSAVLGNSVTVVAVASAWGTTPVFAKMAPKRSRRAVSMSSAAYSVPCGSGRSKRPPAEANQPAPLST